MRKKMLFIPFALLLSACSSVTQESDNTHLSSSISETVTSPEKVVPKRLPPLNKQWLPQIMRKDCFRPVERTTAKCSHASRCTSLFRLSQYRSDTYKARLFYFILQNRSSLGLNADELNQETPIATYLYQYGFASSQETIQVLQPFEIDTNGQQVDLGSRITGYQQGAAGSSLNGKKETGVFESVGII